MANSPHFYFKHVLLFCLISSAFLNESLANEPKRITKKAQKADVQFVPDVRVMNGHPLPADAPVAMNSKLEPVDVKIRDQLYKQTGLNSFAEQMDEVEKNVLFYRLQRYSDKDLVRLYPRIPENQLISGRKAVRRIR